MRKLNVAEDIIPIGEFKTHASELLRNLHTTRRPLVITLNGKAAAVVLTPEEFEDLAQKELVRAKVRLGETRARLEGTISSQEARRRLKEAIRGAGK